MSINLKKIEIDAKLEINKINAELDKYFSLFGMCAYNALMALIFDITIFEVPMLMVPTAVIGVSPFLETRYSRKKLEKELKEIESGLER